MAPLDGRRIRYITIPSLIPTITIMVLMAISRIFYSDFGLFYQVPLNSGPLIDVTNTIDTYVYEDFGENSNIGMTRQLVCISRLSDLLW